MQFDSSKKYIVYPTWCEYSYRWEDLPVLLAKPLESRYLTGRRNWFDLGFSRVTTNFELLDGPFGNGIIRHEPGKLIDTERKDAWLPSVVLGAEATFTIPKGLPRFESREYGVSYLSPKPTDAQSLGVEGHKEPPMPYFSVEHWPGMQHSALVCLGVSGDGHSPADIKEFPFWLRAWGIKSELLQEETPACRETVGAFFRKWRLKGTWYFAGSAGRDAGLVLAMLVYLGGHLRSRSSRLKSIHMITTLPTCVRMCERWSMKRLL